MTTAQQLGEDALISRLLTRVPCAHPEMLVGPGDDCAVVEHSRTLWQLLKTDAIVENIHFSSDENMTRVGWKAIARVISDFAAMGGYAQWFLITIAIPTDQSVLELENLYDGMSQCLKKYGGTLSGGETTSLPAGGKMVISIAATGIVEKRRLIKRSTARLGDCICVTGRLGGSLAGRHLDIVPRVDEARWLSAQRFATAMMDLSDGLAKDLPRLAQSSHLGFQIDSTKIPRHGSCTIEQAIGDGEDYELLFTVSPRKITALLRDWSMHFADTSLSCIGKMVNTADSMILHGGWDHFS
jgi:thiamine-monophosphate kinase